jgi:hypothetical protein
MSLEVKYYLLFNIPKEISCLNKYLNSDCEIIKSYYHTFIKKSLDSVGLYKVLNEIIFEYYNFNLCGCCGINSVINSVTCITCCLECQDCYLYGYYCNCNIMGLKKFYIRHPNTHYFNCCYMIK